MTELPKAPPLTRTDLNQPTTSPATLQHALRWAWPTVGVALFAYGITAHGKWWVGSIGFLILLLSLGGMLNRRDERALKAARSGAVRVETIKQTHVGNRVALYARAGWVVDGQSSSKSFGSQARVTITFRKL